MATATAQVSIRTTPELKERIQRLADETGRTVSWYMNKVLEEKIDDLEDIYLAEKTLEEIRVGSQSVSSSDDVYKDLGI